MRISVFCLTVNLLFAILLIQPFRAAGLGLANTATSFLNVGLLVYCLNRKLGRLDLGPVARQLSVMLPAVFASGLLAWWLGGWWESRMGHQTLLARFVGVFGPMLPAAALYWLGTWMAGVPAARDVYLALVSKFQRSRHTAR
jgi:peptidoglycan biosynthesis protein MviN/MurJ (putative lipid II flippase)